MIPQGLWNTQLYYHHVVAEEVGRNGNDINHEQRCAESLGCNGRADRYARSEERRVGKSVGRGGGRVGTKEIGRVYHRVADNENRTTGAEKDEAADREID